jgi:hypothetical protein
VAEKERVRRKQKSTEKSKVSEEATQVHQETVIEDSKIDVEESEVATVKEIVASSVEETKQQSDVLVKEPKFLPSWGDVKQTEWMYHIPIREEDLEMWSSEWADFVLEWCEEFTVHILTFSMFVSEIPFKDIQNKADAYRIIGDKLVEKEVGVWMEGKKRQLRVFWRFLEEWADIVYTWALEHGQTRLDVKSIVIQEPDQGFAKLPEKELHYILKILVERNLAEWIDKQKGAVRIQV